MVSPFLSAVSVSMASRVARLTSLPSMNSAAKPASSGAVDTDVARGPLGNDRGGIIVARVRHARGFEHELPDHVEEGLVCGTLDHAAQHVVAVGAVEALRAGLEQQRVVLERRQRGLDVCVVDGARLLLGVMWTAVMTDA